MLDEASVNGYPDTVNIGYARYMSLPTPGSDDAIDQGCICTRRYNNSGLRPPFPPNGWIISPDCKMHSPDGPPPEAKPTGKAKSIHWPFT